MNLNCYKNKKIFFSGIGGVSMSSLALILKNNGFDVCGSDRTESSNTIKLKNERINVVIGQNKENINSDIGLIVRTAAVSTDNPEILQGVSLGIDIMERSTLLGLVMKDYTNRVNVCGTHGKTTTTSMLALLFMYANLEPTVTVGGDFKKMGGNLLLGKKDYFVCEACEYVESFLEFFPSVSVFLNIEEDHLDYYKDINHIKSAFYEFALKTEELIVANGDDENVCDVMAKLEDKKVVFFGIENGKYVAKNIKFDRYTTTYDLFVDDVFTAKITLKVAGIHNVYNSLSVCAVCMEKGIDIENAKSALFDFEGADRRMQYKGTVNGAEIFDDYAHHPTEIRTTIESVKQKHPKHFVALFQPHTYTRTKALKNEFKDVLKDIEKLYVADIYAAREKDPGDISSKDLCEGLSNAHYVGSLENAYEKIKNELTEGDIFVTIGAGNVYTVGEKLVDECGEK